MPFQNFMTDERGFEAKQQDGPAGAMRIRSAGQTAAMMRQMQPQPITIVQNISTPDVESFRQSQSQLAARATMFLARGRRNQ